MSPRSLLATFVTALILQWSSTVGAAVDLWGRAGTFGGLTSATQLPSGEGLAVHANGYGVDLGQGSWYGATTSDGTLFVGALTQTGSQFDPSGCTMEIVCFNPSAPTCRDPSTGLGSNLAKLRVPALDGTLFAPDSACQTTPLGTDVSDLAVWVSGGEERVSFVSTNASGDAIGWPIWGELRKIGGLWQIDLGARLWPRDIKAATGPPLSDVACQTVPKNCCSDDACGGGTCPDAASCLFTVPGHCRKSCTRDSDCAPLGPLDYCENGQCTRTNCRAPQEVDVLPASNRMAVAEYFGSVVVTDGRARVLAAFSPPLVPDPCRPGRNLNLDPRQVVVDPTSTYGDERFTVVYDSSDLRAQPLQEFRYDDATQTLEPVTTGFVPTIAWLPPPDCSGTNKQGGSAQYDEFGNLWVGAVRLLQTHRLVFLKDPFTGRHSAAERCSALDPAGQPRPWAATCRADLGIGYWNNDAAAPAFSMPWANPVAYDPAATTAFGVSNNGLIAPMPIAEYRGQHTFAILPPVDLDLKDLGRVTGEAVQLSGSGPELPLDHSRRKLWVPIRGTVKGAIGADAPQWLYRADVDEILARRPRLLEPLTALRDFGDHLHLSVGFRIAGPSPLPATATAVLFAFSGTSSTALTVPMDRVDSATDTSFSAALDLTPTPGAKSAHWYAVVRGTDAARPMVVSATQALPPCGRTSGALRVKGLGDGIPGNEELDLRGRVKLAAGVTFADLDPLTEGARLLLAAAGGSIVADLSLPSGAFDGHRGWLGTSVPAGRWRFFAPSGIRSVDIKEKAGGMIDVRVRGTANLPVPLGDRLYRARFSPGDGSDVDPEACGEMRTTSCKRTPSTLRCHF